MDVQEAALTRRSTRKFSSKEVSIDDIMEMVDAGRHAPSAGNLQPWKFVLVKKEEKRKALADASFQQLWIAEAPIVIVIVGMVEEVKRTYGLRGEALYVIQACAMAAENMMLRAHELGLSTSFVSAFEEGMVKRVVEIPDQMRPMAIIPVGYADEEPPEKVLKSFENITNFEEVRRRTEHWDDAFYKWSGLMERHAKSILGRFKKGGATLAKRIHEKLRE